jgi:hypothetical protein
MGTEDGSPGNGRWDGCLTMVLFNFVAGIVASRD